MEQIGSLDTKDLFSCGMFYPLLADVLISRHTVVLL